LYGRFGSQVLAWTFKWSSQLLLNVQKDGQERLLHNSDFPSLDLRDVYFSLG